MGSRTPVSRYIPQNSKKRVFLGGSSSGGCKDVEVLEVSPQTNRTSKPKSSKQKEVICHEIIDVDMEDDDDVMLTDGEVDTSAKGKGVLSNSSAGLTTLANDESAAGLHDSMNADEFSSNLFYGEDEWIDTYYDDILYDDYSILESHFDNMDIPPGVEAPFPWLSTSPKHDSKPATSTSVNPSFAGVDLKSTTWSNNIQMNGGSPNTKGKFQWTSPGQKKSGTSSSSSSAANLSSKSGKETLHSFGKVKRKPRSNPVSYSGHSNPFPSPPTYPNSVGNNGSALNMPAWQDLPLNMLEPSMGPSGYMQDTTFATWQQVNFPANNNLNDASSLPATVEQRNVDEILQRFDVFKRFDTVEDFSDHHYFKNGSAKQQPRNWAKRIQEEWKILEKGLPDEIFVRVCEGRMDLLRAVIIGAEGTPYHDGLFFFDVFFPSSYPNVPPHVHYHSGGLRINPNLYNCGKVCLSLLNTWSGSQKEKWLPGNSTMLQVLVSIQGLILNAKPYFNEPGYANLSGSVSGEKKSLEYNERTFMYSLQTMVYSMRRPPKYFEDFVMGHFCKHARDILVSCKAYLEGAQVGCLVKGGVQDVDEGDKSCSKHLKTTLGAFITILVNQFTQIGAKDLQEFLSLGQKENGQPITAPRPVNLYH